MPQAGQFGLCHRLLMISHRVGVRTLFHLNRFVDCMYTLCDHLDIIYPCQYSVAFPGDISFFHFPHLNFFGILGFTLSKRDIAVLTCFGHDDIVSAHCLRLASY